MKRALAAVAIAASVGTAYAQPTPESIELACTGGGAANKPDTATLNAWNSDGGYASAQAYGTRTVGFEDQVNVSIDGTEGRIRMPRTMLPPIRGGEAGWFKIKSIVMTDREITGSVAVNPFNNPKVRIDRFTGNISISGKAGDYSGHCQRYDLATERRAF